MNKPQVSAKSLHAPRLHAFSSAAREIVAPADKWLPSLLVSFYYLMIWAPSSIPTLTNRWYVILGLAVLAFLLQKSALVAHASRLYWITYGLSFLGAVLSLFRASFIDEALWNTVGMGIGLVTFLLFLPVVATTLTRRFLLVILVVTSFLWTFEIQRLVNTYGTLAYSTFAETGDNKNAVGYGLALSTTLLFYLALVWNSQSITKWHSAFLKVFFMAAAFYIFYYQALIYARGSLIAAVFGFLIVIILALRTKQKNNNVFWLILLFILIFIFIVFAVPVILETSPTWDLWYQRFVSDGADDLINGRDVLLQKGLYLIYENPIIGVGLGGSRYPVSLFGETFPGYLIHNTYLTDWAEIGILGPISSGVWILGWALLVRKRFWQLPTTDQIWLVLFLPIFIQMGLKNVSSLVMVVILAGIYYQQYLLDQQLARSDKTQLPERKS